VKTIELIVTSQGETQLATKGFTGPACQQASLWLEQALGARTSNTPTAEFYQTDPLDQSQREPA